jgi:hypothetical protein
VTVGLYRIGLKVAIADVNERRLDLVGQELIEMIGKQNVLVVPTDVSKLDQVVRLKHRVYDTWGEVSNYNLEKCNERFTQTHTFKTNE